MHGNDRGDRARGVGDLLAGVLLSPGAGVARDRGHLAGLERDRDGAALGAADAGERADVGRGVVRHGYSSSRRTRIFSPGRAPSSCLGTRMTSCISPGASMGRSLWKMRLSPT